jgi:heme/copper-type cytochrome/quinol oxidase subunit 3
MQKFSGRLQTKTWKNVKSKRSKDMKDKTVEGAKNQEFAILMTIFVISAIVLMSIWFWGFKTGKKSAEKQIVYEQGIIT